MVVSPARRRVRRVLTIDVVEQCAELLLVHVANLSPHADAVVPRGMQDHLARSIPDSALLVYHGVGHTPRWEDPTRFSSDLAAFARQVGPTQP